MLTRLLRSITTGSRPVTTKTVQLNPLELNKTVYIFILLITNFSHKF